MPEPSGLARRCHRGGGFGIHIDIVAAETGVLDVGTDRSVVVAGWRTICKSHCGYWRATG